MDAISCQVCLRPYNETENVPLIFRSCGHSVCRACLLVLAQEPSETPVVRIPCPCCRQPHFFDKERETFDQAFPKNYLFLQHFSARKEGCIHPTEKRKFACADAQCPETQTFCFECARKIHGNCQANSVIKTKRLAEAVVFEAKDVNATLGVNKLKQSIETTLEDAKTRLFSFMDAVDQTIAREGELLAKSRQSPEFFWKNKQMFSNSMTEDPDRFFLELRNNDSLERMAFKVTQEVRESIIPAFQSKVDASINWIVAEILPELATLNHAESVSVRESADLLQKMDRLLLKGQLLSSFKGPAHFTFPDYFRELTSHLANHPIVFTELDSHNVSTEHRATAREVVAQGFQKELKSQESVAKFVEQRFNELHQPSNWHVRLSYLSPAALTINDKRFLHLYRNSWHLVIKEVEAKPQSITADAYTLQQPDPQHSDQPDRPHLDRSLDDGFDDNQYGDFDDSEAYYD